MASTEEKTGASPRRLLETSMHGAFALGDRWQRDRAQALSDHAGSIVRLAHHDALEFPDGQVVLVRRISAMHTGHRDRLLARLVKSQGLDARELERD